METKSIQLLFDIVSNCLPAKWYKIAMYFSYSGNAFIGKFYVDEGKGYKDCYNLGCERQAIKQILRSMEAIVVKERNELPEGNRWSIFTVFIQENGRFNVSYSYDDISETFLDQLSEWEKQYIRQG